MKVILISGKAGSGKDEVAKLLKMYLGNTVITKLAKYIKLFSAERSFIYLYKDFLNKSLSTTKPEEPLVITKFPSSI